MLFARLDENSGYVSSALLPLFIHAIGIALVFAPGTLAIMHRVPDEHAGSASDLLQMDQQIGGALGIAVTAAVYAMGSQPERFSAGLSTSFLVAAGISLVAGAIVLRT